MYVSSQVLAVAKLLNELLDRGCEIVAASTIGAEDVEGCVLADVIEPGLSVEWAWILTPCGNLSNSAIDFVLEFYGCSPA